MDKIKAAILAILEDEGRIIHRTRLVKLVYLADNMHYEHFGETITGLKYMWDNHGPNAISNAIVKEADNLVNDDFICMQVGTSMYGGENFRYTKGTKSTDISKTKLSSMERQVLSDIVNQNKNKNLSEIVSVSKKTTPFKEASQYEVLKMSRLSKYQELIQSVRADTEFMNGVREGMGVGPKRGDKSLEEVKLLYGL
ncbi:MAG: SocA family protein [Chloroflexi bacterium]|nr:SocA family protein [Chloroflexota bacterium]